jgi:hypothetical protein
MGDLMISFRIALLTCLAFLMTVVPLPVPADDSVSVEGAPGPAAVVRAFNDSISAGDAEGAVAQVAPGGVQFTLQSSHDEIQPEEITASLSEYWSMILPVVFASTEKYVRRAEILAVERHGNIATVWTNISTQSFRRGKGEPSESEFTELYVLADLAGGFRIVSISNNRPASPITAN